MSNISIPENPEFSLELRQLLETDPAHADLFNELSQRLLENDAALLGEKEPIVNAATLNGKKDDEFAEAEHSHESKDVGLGNVPNVATNDQTPTYDVADKNEELESGEKLGIAFGKIAKVIVNFISHIADAISHVTSADRKKWDDSAAATHSHNNSSVLEKTTASYTLEQQTKLTNIEAGAQKNTITGIKGSAETNYRTGNVSLSPENIGAAKEQHGNHVPAVQTADNKKFLRNDNSWQEVTPANIGAAASDHDQSAATITDGIFKGKVQANGGATATLTDSQVRNIVILASDPGEGASVSYANGTIVFTK